MWIERCVWATNYLVCGLTLELRENIYKRAIVLSFVGPSYNVMDVIADIEHLFLWERITEPSLQDILTIFGKFINDWFRNFLELIVPAI